MNSTIRFFSRSTPENPFNDTGKNREKNKLEINRIPLAISLISMLIVSGRPDKLLDGDNVVVPQELGATDVSGSEPDTFLTAVSPIPLCRAVLVVPAFRSAVASALDPDPVDVIDVALVPDRVEVT
jgi:hypothetical protein